MPEEIATVSDGVNSAIGVVVTQRGDTLGPDIKFFGQMCGPQRSVPAPGCETGTIRDQLQFDVLSFVEAPRCCGIWVIEVPYCTLAIAASMQTNWDDLRPLRDSLRDS